MIAELLDQPDQSDLSDPSDPLNIFNADQFYLLSKPSGIDPEPVFVTYYYTFDNFGETPVFSGHVRDLILQENADKEPLVTACMEYLARTCTNQSGLNENGQQMTNCRFCGFFPRNPLFKTISSLRRASHGLETESEKLQTWLRTLTRKGLTSSGQTRLIACWNDLSSRNEMHFTGLEGQIIIAPPGNAESILQNLDSIKNDPAIKNEP